MEANRNAQAVFGDDDYLPLEALSLSLDKESMGESGAFTLCFWIYLLKSANSGLVIIRQGRTEESAAVPLLTVDSDRKLVLHPLRSAVCEAIKSTQEEEDLVISDQACPMEKWVHVGCEIGARTARLHMIGTLVGERHGSVPAVIENIVNNDRVLLLGGRNQTEEACPRQGFVYFVRLLPQPTITNHYVKNPPLELLLDGPSCASDDYKVEEGGDGVWSVVGGKASCRRNFALDVALVDALGRSVHKEMELVAFLVFADTGLPVEKTKDDAEAPLLTTFDGVEFPSSERPIKLVHGRVSFKLKISQLSSKCDNRLFRVCFDSPSAPKFPFLRVLSRPIRCVSRNRNNRVPAAVVHWKHTSPAAFPINGSKYSGADEAITVGASQRMRDSPCINDSTVPGIGVRDLCYLSGQPPFKRARTRPQREVLVPAANGHGLRPSPPDNTLGISADDEAGAGQSPKVHSPKPILPAISILSGVNWPAGAPYSLPARNFKPAEAGGAFETEEAKLEMFSEDINLAATTGIVDSKHFRRWIHLWSDQLVFKYCLESMHGRSEFLKAFVVNRGEQELTEFAARVSQLTGCRHDGYQILIARTLLCSGNEVWSKVSQESCPPLWVNVVKHIDQTFTSTSGCINRSLSAKDTDFLKRIAGCGDFVSREEFGRLWSWIYPVALAVRSSQVRSTWENEDPRWIEGMITRDEVERLLLKSGDAAAKPGTFLLRFASSRQWPHPDSGALVVSYVGSDMRVYHKLLSLDDSFEFNENDTPLQEQLLAQPELTQLCKIPSRAVAG